MSTGRPLPIAVPVEDDESWDSYLTRAASANRTTVLSMAQHIGIVVNSRWPAFYAIRFPSPSTLEHAAHGLSIEPQQIMDMHLQVFDQLAIDLTPLSSPHALRGVASACRTWAFLTGSRYCPACLSADGRWRLTWRLPWVTGCLHHGLLLGARCHACGQFVRSGKAEHASRPRLASARPDTLRCSQPTPGTGSGCPARLDETEAQVLTPRELAPTERALTTVSANAAVVLGARQPALATFRAWQTAACYARTLKVVPVADDPRDNAAPRRPPRSARHMLDLQVVAWEVLDAPTPEAGADVLASWCDHAGVTPTPALFDDSAAPSEALQSAVVELLRRHGRAHSMLGRSLDQLDPQLRLGIVDFETDDIPQVAWPCALRAVTRASTGPTDTALRVVLSLTLARIAGARTWQAAGLALGWATSDGSQWARYAFAGRNVGLRRHLVEAALATSSLLAAQPIRHAWSCRPESAGPTRRRWAVAQHGLCKRNEPRSLWCPCSTAAPGTAPGPELIGSDTRNRLA